MVKRIRAGIFLLLLLSTTAYASKLNAKVDLSKPYWLNYSLIFFEGCQPKVFPNNIVFTEGACRVDPYSGKIFPRGTKVKIYSVTEGEGFSKIRLRHWPEVFELESEYEIVLKSDSGKSFRKSFALLFTQKTLEQFYETNCPDNVKTKKQLIQCIGFPISATREGDVEKYFYILEFAGPSSIGGSFDGFTVEIKKNKIINVSGYI